MAQPPGPDRDLRPVFAAIREIHSAVESMSTRRRSLIGAATTSGPWSTVGVRQGRVVYERASGRPAYLAVSMAALHLRA
jgi:hypothetical protein